MTENSLESSGKKEHHKRFSLEPLILACETHHPKIMEMALDAFHYIIGNVNLYTLPLIQ
jgi:hypothetical protein